MGALLYPYRTVSIFIGFCNTFGDVHYQYFFITAVIRRNNHNFCIYKYLSLTISLAILANN